jgi:hypothetical protein
MSNTTTPEGADQPFDDGSIHADGIPGEVT